MMFQEEVMQTFYQRYAWGFPNLSFSFNQIWVKELPPHHLEPPWGIEEPQKNIREGEVSRANESAMQKKKKGNSTTWRQVESKGCYISHPF